VEILYNIFILAVMWDIRQWYRNRNKISKADEKWMNRVEWIGDENYGD